MGLEMNDQEKKLANGERVLGRTAAEWEALDLSFQFSSFVVDDFIKGIYEFSKPIDKPLTNELIYDLYFSYAKDQYKLVSDKKIKEILKASGQRSKLIKLITGYVNDHV